MRRARSDQHARAWVATLLGGLAVALVVTGLLDWLRRTVAGVERAVDGVWLRGQHVAQNTQVTHLLQGTAASGAELLQEVNQHARTEERLP